MSKRRAVCSMAEEVFVDFEDGLVRMRIIVYGPNYEDGEKNDQSIMYQGMSLEEYRLPDFLRMFRARIIEKFEDAGWRFSNVH